jgi:hypothetical protein
VHGRINGCNELKKKKAIIQLLIPYKQGPKKDD